MTRYHYIDDQGNISDALPLAALQKIGLPPATKVLVEGGKQWTTLEQVSQGGPVVLPATPPATPTSPPPPLAPAPPIASGTSAAASSPATPADKSKTSATKGCLGCLGVIVGGLVLLGIIGAIVGPSDSTKTDSPKAADQQPDAALVSELQTWLSTAPWKCVDATSKGGEGFPGIMKGATFEFTTSQLRISGGGAEATHTYRIKSVSRSVTAGADLFATLRIGTGEESLLKLKPERGFDFAGMSWGDGAWTLKLARSQR